MFLLINVLRLQKLLNKNVLKMNTIDEEHPVRCSLIYAQQIKQTFCRSGSGKYQIRWGNSLWAIQMFMFIYETNFISSNLSVMMHIAERGGVDACSL